MCICVPVGLFFILTAAHTLTVTHTHIHTHTHTHTHQVILWPLETNYYSAKLWYCLLLPGHHCYSQPRLNLLHHYNVKKKQKQNRAAPVVLQILTADNELSVPKPGDYSSGTRERDIKEPSCIRFLLKVSDAMLIREPIRWSYISVKAVSWSVGLIEKRGRLVLCFGCFEFPVTSNVVHLLLSDFIC